jgi:hypothetical protein
MTLLESYHIAKIDLILRIAGDDCSSGRLGDCCWTDGIQPYLYIDEYVRIRIFMTIYTVWPS